jgi:hypothetical protein
MRTVKVQVNATNNTDKQTQVQVQVNVQLQSQSYLYGFASFVDVNGIQIEKGTDVRAYKKAIAQAMFPEETNKINEPVGNVVRVTMPDGKTGTIPKDQVNAFKKKYPGATFR